MEGGVGMIDEERKAYLKSLGFRVTQFDQKGAAVGNPSIFKDYEALPDPNHFVAHLTPYAQNGIYWAWPRMPQPATEEECWTAIDQAVTAGEIDFETFNGLKDISNE